MDNFANLTMPEGMKATTYRKDRYKSDAKEIESDTVMLAKDGVLSQRKVFSLNLANFGFYESSTGTRRFKRGEKEEMVDDLRKDGYRMARNSLINIEIKQENMGDLLYSRFYSASSVSIVNNISKNQLFSNIPFHELNWGMQDAIKRAMNEAYPDKCLHYGDVMLVPIAAEKYFCFVSFQDEEMEGEILQFESDGTVLRQNAELRTDELKTADYISFDQLKRRIFEFSAMLSLMCVVSNEIPDACRGDVKEITNKLKDIGDAVMENGDWLQNSGDWKHICCADKTGDIYYGESLYMEDARAIFNCLLTQVEDYAEANL